MRAVLDTEGRDFAFVVADPPPEVIALRPRGYTAMEELLLIGVRVATSDASDDAFAHYELALRKSEEP